MSGELKKKKKKRKKRWVRTKERIAEEMPGFPSGYGPWTGVYPNKPVPCVTTLLERAQIHAVKAKSQGAQPTGLYNYPCKNDFGYKLQVYVRVTKTSRKAEDT